MAGRPPKEKSFANMLNIALTSKGDTGQTKLREVAEVLVSKALDGEGWAIKEIADRTDGKPFQQIEVTGDEDNPLSVVHQIRLVALSPKSDK
jgi:hypothetical protein